MTQRKYKALKNHICRFNDGECFCKCFDKGYRKAFKDIAKFLKEDDIKILRKDLLTTHNK